MKITLSPQIQVILRKVLIGLPKIQVNLRNVLIGQFNTTLLACFLSFSSSPNTRGKENMESLCYKSKNSDLAKFFL